MPKILIGTHNPAKKEEYQKILSTFGMATLNLKDIGITQDYQEQGSSFAVISLAKAKFYAKISGQITLADDGGLVIDALGGWPGIKSRRLDQEAPHSDKELVDFVLKKMEKIKNRSAGLVVVITIYHPLKDRYIQVQGRLDGYIVEHVTVPIVSGFPYRSILYIPKAGKLCSEFTAEDHESYNHRQKALEQIQDKLAHFLA